MSDAPTNMCHDCALKAGYTPKKKAIGFWMEDCPVCGRHKATCSLSHDYYPPKKRRYDTQFLLAALASSFVAGCTVHNQYDCYIEFVDVEEQMRIVKYLEENGWENVGVSRFENKLHFIATRKKAR